MEFPWSDTPRFRQTPERGVVAARSAEKPQNRHSHTTGWIFQRVTAEQKIPGIKLQATGIDK
jgi:hypothetical protein